MITSVFEELTNNGVKGSRIAFLLFVSLLCGCSLEANIDSLTEFLPTIYSKATMTEVTPASNQNASSNRGYGVQSSLSFQTNQSTGVTSRGFKVQTSVQGTIFRE